MGRGRAYSHICEWFKLTHCINIHSSKRRAHQGFFNAAEESWPTAVGVRAWGGGRNVFSMEPATLNHFISQNPKDLLHQGFQNIFLPEVLMCVIKAAKLCAVHRDPRRSL